MTVSRDVGERVSARLETVPALAWFAEGSLGHAWIKDEFREPVNSIQALPGMEKPKKRVEARPRKRRISKKGIRCKKQFSFC
jgi:hypothetical protein